MKKEPPWWAETKGVVSERRAKAFLLIDLKHAEHSDCGIFWNHLHSPTTHYQK
jgi:hypothetical protein